MTSTVVTEVQTRTSASTAASLPIRRHSWAGFAIAGGLLALLSALWVGASFVDLYAHRIPAHVEERIGDAFRRTLSTSLLEDHAERIARLQAKSDELAAILATRPLRWIGVVADEQATAWILPGPGLVITLPMLENATGGDDIHFLLGHVLGHVSENDQRKVMGRGLAAAVVLDFLGFGHEALARLQLSDGILRRQRFTASQETTADHAGLLALHRRSGKVIGAEQFFSIFEKTGWPSSHFAETPTSAQARQRSLGRIVADEGFRLD